MTQTQQQQLKIEDVDTTQLKAYAYDALAQIQSLQQQVQAINMELARRSQPKVEKVEAEVVEPK